MAGAPQPDCRAYQPVPNCLHARQMSPSCNPDGLLYLPASSLPYSPSVCIPCRTQPERRCVFQGTAQPSLSETAADRKACPAHSHIHSVFPKEFSSAQPHGIPHCIRVSFPGLLHMVLADTPAYSWHIPCPWTCPCIHPSPRLASARCQHPTPLNASRSSSWEALFLSCCVVSSCTTAFHPSTVPSQHQPKSLFSSLPTSQGRYEV